MTYVADLAPCTYLSKSDRVLSVAFLSADHDYTRGRVDEPVFDKLMELLQKPWAEWYAAGFHECELCRFSGSAKKLWVGERTVTFGATNLFVPAQEVVYGAPSMIVHYIDSHEYAPPPQFCQAVLDCPEMGSEDYKHALARSAPGAFPGLEKP